MKGKKQKEPVGMNPSEIFAALYAVSPSNKRVFLKVTRIFELSIPYR